MTLFTPAWWEAAGARAAHTALALAAGLVLLVAGGTLEPLGALSMVAVVVVASLATSLAGLPEVQGKVVPLWRAVIVRTAKTLGQTLAASLVGVELIEAVDWRAALVAVGAAVLVTLLRTLKAYLPEQEVSDIPAGYHYEDEGEGIAAPTASGGGPVGGLTRGYDTPGRHEA